jgi:predicted DCC family thiol-disulfide oxidoreductase YuxK
MTDRESHPVVLFDGVCNLCNATVNWIIARDRKGLFRFAALQSVAGVRLQREHGLDPTALDTLVLVEGGRTYRKSSAGLRIVRRLCWPWPLLFGLIAVPAFMRDFAYGWFARRRYRWFGRKDECMAPAPEVRERFLLD